MFEIEYEFREKDLVHFNELRLANDPVMQKKIRQNRMLVPGIMLVFGLFYYVYYTEMMTTAYITLLAIAWGQYTEAEKKRCSVCTN